MLTCVLSGDLKKMRKSPQYASNTHMRFHAYFMRISCVLCVFHAYLFQNAWNTQKCVGGHWPPTHFCVLKKIRKKRKIRMKYTWKTHEKRKKTQKNAFNTPVRIENLLTHNTHKKRIQKTHKYADMFWCVFNGKTRNQHGRRMKYANGEKAMPCYRKLERWLSVRAAGLLVENHWFGTSPLPSLGWRTVFLSWKGAVCVAEILNAKWRRASNLRWCIWNQRSWIQPAALFSFRTKGELSASLQRRKHKIHFSTLISELRHLQ